MEPATTLDAPLATASPGDTPWRRKLDGVERLYHIEAADNGLTGMSARMASLLPEPSALDQVSRAVLTDPTLGTYSVPVLAAVWHAASHSRSRSEFDRFLGLFDADPHGHIRWVMRMELYPGGGSDSPALQDVREVLRGCFQRVKRSRVGPCDCGPCTAYLDAPRSVKVSSAAARGSRRLWNRRHRAYD